MRNAIIKLANRDRPADRPDDRGGRFRGQHAGLLLQRFAIHSADGSEQWSKEKRTILKAAIAAVGDPELRRLYEAAFKRWEKSLPPVSESDEMRTSGRLIVGLGSENVLETGIRLHHSYGLPLIPGSALKGLAAHYCHEVWGRLSAGNAAPNRSKRFRRDWKEKGYEYHKLLFGTTDDSGCITFHDAWLTPDSPNPLALDVMTPHHPDWVDGAKTPTDFDSPVPVPFVSVDGKFRIAVSWTGPESDESKNWTEFVFARLREALREWGVGGKTSSGYGRLIDADAHRAAPSQPPQGQAPTVQWAARAAEDPDKVTVKVLQRRDIGGKAQFFVQEEGKPRGVLAYGNPPPTDKLPQVGDSIAVYRNNRDLRNPQYRWDKPASGSQGKSKGGPGGKPPPRGGRR